MIGLVAYANSGTVTAKKVNVNRNQSTRMMIGVNNNLLVDTISALDNTGDGLFVIQSDNTKLVDLRNGKLHGNTESGLEVDTSGNPSLVKISRTSYYGNNADNIGSDPDIHIY